MLICFFNKIPENAGYNLIYGTSTRKSDHMHGIMQKWLNWGLAVRWDWAGAKGFPLVGKLSPQGD